MHIDEFSIHQANAQSRISLVSPKCDELAKVTRNKYRNSFLDTERS